VRLSPPREAVLQILGRKVMKSWQGRVVSIHVAARASVPTQAVEQARAVPGRGLEGDRYFLGVGFYSGRPGWWAELTLIESEAMEAVRRDYGIELDAGETRRNIVTRDVPLNHLAGIEFRVGEVRLAGWKLWEPCGHLEKLTRPMMRAALAHRGGLAARILTEGWIRVGDAVRPDGPA
jgi:MOSC domain-containing protein YiiM